MATTLSTDLMQIYEDIYAKKVSHCALCYRSDTETRLLKSRVFKKVVQALKYAEVFMKNENLCYMCEARMASVAKFVDMLHLALEVQRVFMRAEMSTKYRKRIMAERLKLCQRDFTKFRTKVQLRKTNVLLVDSLKTTDEAPPTMPDPVDNSNTNLSEPEIETVLINDKVQVETDTMAELPQINPLVIPFALSSPTDFILTIGTENKLYMVPTLNGSFGVGQTIATNSPILLMNNIKEKPDEEIKTVNETKKCSILPSIADCRTDSNAFLEGTVVEGTRRNNLKKLPAKNVKKRPNEEIKMVKKTKIYSNLPTIVDCKTDNNAFIKEIAVEDNGKNTTQQSVPEVVKHPIRTDSEVDWEDKIPMEVISFVDDEPAPTDAKNVIGKKTPEIIDLC